jgi:cobyrinic acid a,c-diamide synthase
MSKKIIPRIVISALRGSSGKTILSLSLAALFRRQGLKVTPFKKGPDYIDAGWLAKAAGGPCFNLDLFMMPRQKVLQSFLSHTADTDIAVIEGNRGLYDGVDFEGTYSTAGLAKLLKAPVILVIDCTKATSTISAMVLGCQKLDPRVHIRGVVLNNIANKRQELLIRKAISRNCKLPVLGALPKLKEEPFPERHMGLVPFQEHSAVKKSISRLAEIGSKYLDLNAIWKIAKGAGRMRMGIRGWGLGISEGNKANPQTLTPKPYLKIGIIRDSAFQFYYPENFEELERRGVKLIEISAIKEKKLPDIDALYIGGGFPETHAIALAMNTAFKKSLCSAVENGLPVYAECGGLMYLGKNLIMGNKTYPMAGVLPVVFGMERKPQAHGYTIIEVKKENPFFPKGCSLKGHEFHYSKVLELKGTKASMVFRMRRGHGIKDGKDGLCYKNVLATYTHLHALGSKEWVDGFIKCAAKFRTTRRR